MSRQSECSLHLAPTDFAQLSLMFDLMEILTSRCMAPTDFILRDDDDDDDDGKK